MDQGLKRAMLTVKGWVETFDKCPPVKFLSYMYHPEVDCFSVRPKVNWSKKRRGARTSPDVKTVDGLKKHIKDHPVTKRSIAGVCMSSLHDPLGLMAPYNLNLKDLKLDWDQPTPKEIEDELFTFLCPFLKMEEVLFARRVCFIEADKVVVMVYFDGSNTALGVSIYVMNIFSDGQIIVRLLKNKIKLIPMDANTTPRAELLACLICMRLLETIESDLKYFFEIFKGEIVFEVYGDSAIVLSQLLKDSWLFKQWVQLRVDEIQQLKKNMKQEVSFFHIPSGENKADILTRNHSEEPVDLPYMKDWHVGTTQAVL